MKYLKLVLLALIPFLSFAQIGDFFDPDKERKPLNFKVKNDEDTSTIFSSCIYIPTIINRTIKIETQHVYNKNTTTAVNPSAIKADFEFYTNSQIPVFVTRLSYFSSTTTDIIIPWPNECDRCPEAEWEISLAEITCNLEDDPFFDLLFCEHLENLLLKIKITVQNPNEPARVLTDLSNCDESYPADCFITIENIIESPFLSFCCTQNQNINNSLVKSGINKPGDQFVSEQNINCFPSPNNGQFVVTGENIREIVIYSLNGEKLNNSQHMLNTYSNQITIPNYKGVVIARIIDHKREVLQKQLICH